MHRHFRALTLVLLVATGCGKLLGVDHIPYAGDAGSAHDASPDGPTLAPMLQAGSASYDFGDVTIGHPSFALTVDLTNVGNAPTGTLALSKDGDAGDFTVSTDGCSGMTLAPGAGCQVMVSFAPGSAGMKSSMFTFTDNSTMASTTLKGNALTAGALDMSPSPLDFGNHDVGTTSLPTNITLKNTGGSPITVMSLALSDMTTFSYDASACTLPKTLPANGTCVVTVKFSPHLGGSHVASLTATTDASSNNMTSVSLGGTGQATINITHSGTGTGSIMSGNGAINCGTTCSATFTTPTVTLTASPDTYNEFNSWSANCSPTTNATCTVQTNMASFAVDVVFMKFPTLTLKVTGAGGVVGGAGNNCTGTCTYQVPFNTTFTLTPGGVNTFNIWAGDENACIRQNVNDGNTAFPNCTFSIGSDVTVIADFTNDYTINFIPQFGTAIDPQANINLSVPDRNGQSSCASGNLCTFHYAQPLNPGPSATATSGMCAKFARFYGECVGSPCNVAMSQKATTLNYNYGPGTGINCLR